MQPDHLFHWAGEQIGRLIRILVDALGWFFGHIFGAIDSFYTGLTGELGISGSLTSLLILVVGVLIVLSGLRSLLKRRLIRGAVMTLLGVLLLSWLIH